MLHLLLLAAAVLQDSAARVQTSVPADSYADSATADVVRRARAARERNERLVTGYTAQVSQRIGVGIRAASRDRMLFRQEVTAKITWKRDSKSTIEAVGARQAVPIAIRGDHVPDDLNDELRDLVVNPAEDYLRLVGAGADQDGFIYPLKLGGENDYRFALGDTTVISLPTGRRIRLLQLKVTPRRSEWRLMSGALWFDADTYGLVRAVFKPARPFEFRRDIDKKDQEDVPSWVNPSGEVKYVTLEYSLYENRWWMLRYAAIDAVGTMGSWLGIPVRFERVYSDYEVEGGTPLPPGSTFRPAGTTRRQSDSLWAAGDTAGARRHQDSVRAVRRACIRAAEDRDKAREKESERNGDRSNRGDWRKREAELRADIRQCEHETDDRDSVLTVVVPADTMQLIKSPALGPPILDMGDLITESELKGLADAIKQLPGAPYGTQLNLPHGVMSVLQNARYNRVEGLSLGASGKMQSGRWVLDGLGRIGIADLVPNGELGVASVSGNARFRLGVFRRLAAVNPDTRPFGPVNSTWAFFGARDDGDYFRTGGVELTGDNINSGVWSWRIYAERQRSASVETNFSLPHLFDGDNLFRPNVIADRADQLGAALTFRKARSLSHTLLLGGEATIDGATGDFDFGRGSATLRAIVTPPGPWAMALEASAGASRGTLPIQSRFYLGGPATLRGYSGAAISGATFWRGRAEVGNSFPAARITAFSDIGWAGPSSDFWTGRPLLSAGVGASLLDGLVRMDLSRALRAPTGWRFDLYFDGRL